jgi:hypothetical protein
MGFAVVVGPLPSSPSPESPEHPAVASTAATATAAAFVQVLFVSNAPVSRECASGTKG